MDCNAICTPNNANNLELQEVQSFYIKNKNNLKCTNININSIKYKFSPLADVLQRAMIDILSIQETKLDDSFPDGQFAVPGYRLYRKDHRGNSEGLLMLVRDDLPQQRRKDLETLQADDGRSVECGGAVVKAPALESHWVPTLASLGKLLT